MFAPRRIRLHQQVGRALEEVHARRLEEHAAELAEHFSQSTEADDLQKALTDVRLILQSYPMQAALKQVVAAISGNKAWINLLPPNRPLTTAQATELMARLSAMPQMGAILRKAATKAA